jgi:DNA polymerase I-like protein with 3'-5' exonuclease and polymerase domains
MPADGHVLDGGFALDLETTLIDKDRPAAIPTLVLGMAFGGGTGWFIHGPDMLPFLDAHPDNPLVFHNAGFDLAVLQETYKRARRQDDIYQRVERGLVADTQILARLVSLAQVGHTARGQCSLDDCSARYLGIHLAKDAKTPDGESVRLTFGRYVGRPFEEMPETHLEYAAADPVATWLLFNRLKEELPRIKETAHLAFGYGGPDWLDQQWRTHGPLTHDIQLKASIVLDRISREGVLVDQARREEKVARLQTIMTETTKSLAQAGLPVEGKGAPSALRKRIQKLLDADKNLTVNLTPTGQIATDEEQLQELSGVDPMLGVLLEYRHAQKLLVTYAKKMISGQRVYGRFMYLMNTGRTSCGGGFNLQNLPKELGANESETTIRGCFVPWPGNVFVVVDYAQIELGVLGWAWKNQLGFGDSLHKIVLEGHDMHRLIAAEVLGKAPEEVTKAERNAAKPVSLGRPGGLGWKTIQKQALASYGTDLTEQEVRDRMQAYEDLCPELTEHLKSRVDTGLEIAKVLGLTPAAYNQATGKRGLPRPDDQVPQGWLGGMLLKVLESRTPVTKGDETIGKSPREYTAAEIDFFWTAATRIPADELDERFVADIRERRPSPRLRDRVAGMFSREPVFTATGRLRARASYSACRNGIMQGLAADGAIHALWKLWRAGFKTVNFIHDEVICEVPDDERLPERVAEIEKLMIEGMQVVIPAAAVRVETSIRRSFSKSDAVPDANWRRR